MLVGLDKKRKREVKVGEIEEIKSSNKVEIELVDKWNNVAYDREAAGTFSLFGNFGIEEEKREEKIEKTLEEKVEKEPAKKEKERKKSRTNKTEPKKEILLLEDKPAKSFEIYGKPRSELKRETVFHHVYNPNSKENEPVFMRTETVEEIKSLWEEARPLVRKVYKNMRALQNKHNKE